MTTVYLLILGLVIYSGLITYLYIRSRSKQEGEKEYNNDVDVKIQEIGERLDEIKDKSTKTTIDLEDEDW